MLGGKREIQHPPVILERLHSMVILETGCYGNFDVIWLVQYDLKGGQCYGFLEAVC